MIAQDFIHSPQKYFFLVSLLGIIGCDIGIAVLISLSPSLFLNYKLTLIKIVIMFLMLYIFAILSFTWWKGCFFQNLLKTYLRRFLLFFVIVSFHTSIVLEGSVLIILIEYYKYLLPGYKVYDDKYEIHYIVLLAAILISMVIFFIGLTIAHKNPSDKEIVESINQNFYQDYLRDPQKKILCTSLFLLYLFSFLQCGNVFLSYFNNKDKGDFFYIIIFSFSIFILLTGVFQVLFIFINSIYAFTCWRGKFVQRFFDNPVRRYLYIIYGTNFYYISSYNGYFVYKFLKKLIDNSIFFLILAIGQIISLGVFLIGLLLVVENESDKEIIDNAAATVSAPLLNDKQNQYQ